MTQKCHNCHLGELQMLPLLVYDELHKYFSIVRYLGSLQFETANKQINAAMNIFFYIIFALIPWDKCS